MENTNQFDCVVFFQPRLPLDRTHKVTCYFTSHEIYSIFFVQITIGGGILLSSTSDTSMLTRPWYYFRPMLYRLVCVCGGVWVCFSALLRIKTQFYTFLSMGGLGGWEGNDRLQQLKKKNLLVAGSFPWEDFQNQEILKVYITKIFRLI